MIENAMVFDTSRGVYNGDIPTRVCIECGEELADDNVYDFAPHLCVDCFEDKVNELRLAYADEYIDENSYDFSTYMFNSLTEKEKSKAMKSFLKGMNTESKNYMKSEFCQGQEFDEFMSERVS